MELDLLVGYLVGGVDRGRAGVVVVELPGQERSVGTRTAGHLYHARGTEVGPRELLFPCPDQLDRTAGRLGQARRLYGRLSGVLAAIAGAGVGDDHADLVEGQAERLRQLGLDAKGALRSRPDRPNPLPPL